MVNLMIGPIVGHLFYPAGKPQAFATLGFSLIETAKANGLEPYSYLRCLFEQLPLVKDQDGHRGLLPQYINRDLINSAP